ncbi:hypothetical protein HYH03_017359 [Edaphochlamys debaryana]|nr:hypothetical protein HYH03_017359 [Edaphochlamys debaryana]|eukprot:KAG2483836.1 hypothetical protein HYH03_017359 [Edaphochlamys debaryana]
MPGLPALPRPAWPPQQAPAHVQAEAEGAAAADGAALAEGAAAATRDVAMTEDAVPAAVPAAPAAGAESDGEAADNYNDWRRCRADKPAVIAFFEADIKERKVRAVKAERKQGKAAGIAAWRASNQNARLQRLSDACLTKAWDEAYDNITKPFNIKARELEKLLAATPFDWATAMQLAQAVTHHASNQAEQKRASSLKKKVDSRIE